MDYRRIWKKHFGEIPIDEKGHSYEIHHINGNRKNNSIENLICISIQEHYDIHYRQGDYAAAFRIAQRMDLDPKIKSELMSKSNKQRLQEGTHSFQDKKTREIRTQAIRKLVQEGKHPFQNPNTIKKAVEVKQNKYNHEELSEQTKKGWEKWKQSNPDATSRTLQGSKVGADKTRGTKWFHKLNGEQLRTTEDNPRIAQEGWIKGRYNGKELSANANFRKLNKHKNN
jgi:hypothetical protein